MNSKFNNLKCLLAAAAMMFSAASFAQISGNATPNPAVNTTYDCFNDGYYLFTTPTWTITPSTAGDVISVNVLSDHYTSRGVIKWKTPGTATITVTYGSSYTETKTITITCSTIPSAPATPVVTVPICGTSGAATLTATPGTNGDGIKWYTASTGGTLLASTAAYTTPVISTNTTYYAASTNSEGYCVSSRTSVTAAINPIPAVPTTKVDGSRCDVGTVTISATPIYPATTINWYSSNFGGELLGTGTSFTTPALSSGGDYYYYAASASATCMSTTRLPVKATVITVPSPIEFQSSIVFGSGQVTLEAKQAITKKSASWLPDTTNFQVRWFDTQAKADANTPILAKGVSYTTPVIGATTLYYGRLLDKTTGCLGPVSIARALVAPVISTQSLKTEVMRVGGIKTLTDVANLNDSLKHISVSHVDGLGRVIQQIAVKASPAGFDVIQPIEYDDQGRVSKQYLGYAGTTTTGAFHSGYGAEQSAFYTNASKVAHDAYPYAKSVYENSPLGRLKEQTSAGQAWQPGSGHTNTMVYGFNTGSTSSEAEEVRKFNSDGTSSGFYAANILSRTEGVNADGVHTITFTDQTGKTVVTKQQLDESINGTTVNYLETYYVYDDFGRVKFMIQPEGVAALKANGWNLTMAIKKQHVFQYVYDSRGRAIETRVPGKGWSYAVYNQLNQPVLTQDTLLKQTNQWLFMKYDRAGRVVMTGLHTDNTNTTRASLQTIMNNKNYATEKHYEKRNYSGTHKYTNAAFPTSNIEVLSVTYYDTYEFDTYASYTSHGMTGEGSQGQAVGKVTGTKTLIPGTSTWLRKFVYYDSDGRVIQVRSNTHLNTTPENLSTTVYDFEKVLTTKIFNKLSASDTTTVRTKYDYYRQGRVKHVRQKNRNNAEQLVVKYEYNELGQVVDKKLHRKSDGSYIQSVDFRYTLNGQLASINNATLDASTSANDETTDYFGMELLYNATESNLSTTQRYSGMVSAIKWKGPGPTGSNGQRSYAFGYDKSGKLENAAYAVKDGSAWNKEAGAQDEAMTYDRNGNIKTLTRQQRKHQLTGITGSYTSETIDNLSYTYSGANVNSLQKVTDGASTSAASGFDNGASTTGNDYGYDNNGNLLSDANKGITSIVYNFLSKPTQVNFSDGKKIEYVYDAGGNKLTQKLYQGTTLLTTTDYVNGFVYENGTLSFFGSPEGRVVNTSGTLTYEYSIADHQGNTRVVFTSATIATEAPVATFEDSGGNTNEYVNVVGTYVVSATLANHTPAGSKAVRMNQSYPVGPGKSYKVYPGDKVDPSVWSYYESGSGYGTTSPALSAIMGSVASMFGGVSGGSGETGKIYSGISNAFSANGLAGNMGSSRPAAYLNYILVDKDYKFLTMGWQIIPEGTNTKTEVKFDNPILVAEEGFIYVYLSYENVSNNFVYFDDFKVSLQRSNVIQYNEYYPFGLQTSSSWNRENTKGNQFLYNAANELNATSGWYEMFYRGYDPAIGRMLQVDPYAPMYASTTTYNYAMNNPVMMNDPSGGQGKASSHTEERNVDGIADWVVDRMNKINFMDNPGNYYANWDENFRITEGEGAGRWGLFEYQVYAGGVPVLGWRKTQWEWVPEDPGTLYDNETNAYNFMWKTSLKDEKEVYGWLTNKGVLVLPHGKNTKDNGKTDAYKVYQRNGKYYLIHNGQVMRIIGSVHTHPGGKFQSYSDGDLDLLMTYSSMPHFTLGTKEVWGSRYKFNPDGGMNSTVQVKIGTNAEVMAGKSLINTIDYINSLVDE